MLRLPQAPRVFANNRVKPRKKQRSHAIFLRVSVRGTHSALPLHRRETDLLGFPRTRTVRTDGYSPSSQGRNLMRSVGPLAILCGLLPACAVMQAPVNANEAAKLANAHPEDLPRNPTVVVVERVEVPTSRAHRETASASDTLVEPRKKSAAPETAVSVGTREMPGTARSNAAPIFVRSAIPLSRYNLEQSHTAEALEAKQRILDALAETSAIPNDGAAITVITRGDKAILFGRLANENERKLVEDIAGENARRVESHIVIQ